MTKKNVLMTLLFVFTATWASAAQFGGRVGYYANDFKAGFLGVEMVAPLGPVTFNPSIDAGRSEGETIYLGSLDFQLMTRSASGANWWAGLGPTYGHAAGGGSKWGYDVNTGVTWAAAGLNPYATLRYVKIKDFKTVGLGVGLRFGPR